MFGSGPVRQMPTEDIEREVTVLIITLGALGVITAGSYVLTFYMNRAIMRLIQARIAARKRNLFLNDITREQ